MALQKQLAHLNLTGGLQKKDDQFIVIPSKLVQADNVEFDDLSTVKRRGGQASMDVTNHFSSESISDAQRVFSNRGSAVIEAATGSYRATSEGTVQVTNGGGNAPRVFPRASMATSRIGNSLTKAGAAAPLFDLNSDCAVIGDVACYAWETRDPSTNLNTVTVQFVKVSTGAKLTSYKLNTLLSKVRCQPRVVATATSFALFFGIFTNGATSFEIRRIVFDTGGLVSVAEAVVVTSSAGGSPVESTEQFAVLFDVAVAADNTFAGLVYRDVDGPSTLRFYDLNVSTFLTTATSNSVAPSALPTSLTALVTAAGATYRLAAFFSVGATTIRAINFNLASGALTAETTVNTGAVGSTAGRVSAYQNGNNGTITLACDSEPAVVSQSTLRISTFDVSFGSLSECSAFAPWYIAGRIVAYDSRLYLPMMFCSNQFLNSNTYYIIDLTSAARGIGTANNNQPPHVVARIDYGEGPIYRSKMRPHLRVQSTCLVTNGLVYPYMKFETDLVIAGITNDTSACLASATLNFESQLQFEEVNGLTFLAGACPMVYDGTQQVEEGFHHEPFVSGSSGLAPAASGTYGPFPAGSVTFCFTIGWQDAQGNWHESGPSNEVTKTFGVGTEYITPDLILPPTMKTDYRVRLYRTKASSTDTSLYLSITQQGTFISTDTDLDDGEQLYTTGGVLPNTPAPSCRHVSFFQKRLVLSGCGDGSRVYWSKQTQVGYGPEFSSGDPTHQTVVPADKGRAVGTEEMDDRLVILCENGVGMIGGNGPDPTGTQGQYSDFSSIITETGCSWDSPKSIIRGPEGVWFRSPFGIRLVSRGGSLARGQDGKQVGAEVDSLVSGTVVAIAGDAKQQVRFYQSSGTVLVWDYQWTQWTRFTGMANVDAVYADDRYYHLSNVSTTPLLRYTSASDAYDIGNDGFVVQFVGRIKTAWLSFAGIQGFQRVYRLLVLGKTTDGSQSQQAISTTAYYDFNETTGSLASVVVTPVLSGTVQVNHHFVKQKCESIQIEVVIAPSGNTPCVRLTDLTLQVGVKGGTFRQPSSARY